MDQIEMMLMMHMDKPITSTTTTSDIIGSNGHHHFVDSPIMSLNHCGDNIPQYFDSHRHPHGNMFSQHNATISFSSNDDNNNNNNNNSNNNNTVSSPNSHIPYSCSNSSSSSQKQTSMAAMREMIFRIAAMQPIYIDPEAVKAPKRRNVKISKDPQSVAARHRRERISERIRILQRLVPGGTKMDTASMLDEAIHYVKFLKTQVQSLERTAVTGNNNRPLSVAESGFPVVDARSSYFPVSSTASKVAGYHHGHGASQQQYSDDA